MPDIPGNNTTTATISVGGTVSGTLETLGDHDWYRITLTAGQAITVFVDGTTLEDPYLYIRNAAGTVIFENDDISSGINRDSQLSFSAPSSGTYYIDVGAFDEGYVGDYQISVSVYTPPPLATYDQIANQLVEGYWAGDDHHFNVTQGGSLTVNITALTPAGQTLARAALAEWTDIIGVQFVEVSSGGQITFDDNEAGAASDGVWSNGIISSSHVNVSTTWLADYGTGLNSYTFQTYIHEIGHALGLGHAGNYNGSATYPYDASFENDAWVTSIMSYFDQADNTYFAGQGFSQNFVVTPMMADILAMSTLYGLSTTTRTGDTIYGFNTNTGLAIYNASLNPGVNYTIFDNGGIDTLDYSGFSANQQINLNAETFSNVGPNVGNVAIARGVVIENAIGGSGNDTVTGNAAANTLQGLAGNDTLNGGAGADILIGGLGNDVYIVDQAGDAITEAAGAGTDMVVAKVSYALGAGVSVETMTTLNASATTAINLTGNEFGQSLYGNAGNNILTGMGGSDYLVGGAGNDQYYVDNLDYISEVVGGGDDTILVADTYFLRDGIEIETLVAVNQASLSPVNLSGNEFGQSLYGSQGVNSLNGGEGNDFLVGLGGNDFLLGGGGNDNMAGGQGNDIYYVDAAGDRVIEAAGEGDDLAVAFASFALEAGSSVETLSAGGSSAINLTGNALAQSLYGNAGANVLTSGGGADYMVGGGGNDVFVLSNAAITSPGAANIAGIGDYTAGDVVDISQILSVGAGTNVVGGGYLRISASGQLEVDLDGGGNNYVTVGNVAGSGNVMIRYLAGGSATDLSVARSASQSALMSKVATTGQSDMIAGAVAAAGIAALVPAARTADAVSDHVTQSALAMPATSQALMPQLALTAEGGAFVPAHQALAGTDNVASTSKSSSAVQAEWTPQAQTAAQQGTTAPTALDQGTELAAAAAPASHALVAHGIAMPSAAQLQGHAVAADPASEQSLVGQVLLEALAGGTGHGPIDALLEALPAQAGHAAAAGIDHLAQLASFHAAFAETSSHAAFSLETIALHPDATAAA